MYVSELHRSLSSSWRASISLSLTVPIHWFRLFLAAHSIRRQIRGNDSALWGLTCKGCDDVGVCCVRRIDLWEVREKEWLSGSVRRRRRSRGKDKKKCHLRCYSPSLPKRKGGGRQRERERRKMKKRKRRGRERGRSSFLKYFKLQVSSRESLSFGENRGSRW